MPPKIDETPPEIHVDITIVDPDPMPEIRWPLGLNDHPDLAPHFDVAKVLAEPGLDWIELCKMGAHRRTIPKLRDQLVYLRAWCAVGSRDFPTALETLTKLRSTVVPGLAAAIRADLSNVLVSFEPDGARGMVAMNNLLGDTEVLDRLAATYVEIGKLPAAKEINELALANDPGVSPSKTCQRLTRRVLLDPDAFRNAKNVFATGPVRGLKDDPSNLLFGAQLNADPQCKELDAQLSCWLAKSKCGAWYKLRGLTEADAYLLAAKNVWPTDEHRREPDAWMRVVTPAMNARPDPRGYQMAITALESSLVLTRCEDTRELGNIEWFATELISDAKLPADMKPRAERIRQERDTRCWKAD